MWNLGIIRSKLIHRVILQVLQVCTTPLIQSEGAKRFKDLVAVLYESISLYPATELAVRTTARIHPPFPHPLVQEQRHQKTPHHGRLTVPEKLG
jgi:hypothetical protein